MNRIFNTAIALAALGLVGVAGAASADEPTEGRMVVSVADLNTHSHEGATVALRRIKTAASQFCGPQSRDIQTSILRQRCVKEMTGKAVAKLDAPMVTALYSGPAPIQLAQNETAAR